MHTLQFGRLPSDESQALSNPFASFSSGSRGSMVLYRLADPGQDAAGLAPPRFSTFNRDSVYSTSGDSFVSLSAESKYPSGFPGMGGTERGLVPYAYDPTTDEMDPVDEEDMLHDPSDKKAVKRRSDRSLPWRGILNITALLLLIAGLLILFIFYPVLTFVRNAHRMSSIDGNIRVNGTGQVPVLFQMPEMIDRDTPDKAKTRTGFDGEQYELVFSDEFETPGRTFYPGDDPFWEAVDLWYGVTGDLEWYDPGQVTTEDGAMVITMDNLYPNIDPNSVEDTSLFDQTVNHGLQFRSGMVQTWNKFCFTTGYIEVSVIFPGPNENTQGYWPGAWTMGNLGRPGYPSTTDGTWPYSYNSCDVGTYPNQTEKDRSGPAAALTSEESRDKYHNELSWLPGQRLSSCTCPGEDHPGPDVTVGRGAPELDIFETEYTKHADVLPGQVVSQSAQFAPFSTDYQYLNATTDEYTNFDDTRTMPNSYRGSAIQQSVSSLTKVPSEMFQGMGKNYRTLGFEYHSDPKDPSAGFVTWQVDGRPSHRVGAGAVGPDSGTEVGQRLIPVEPMSIVMNLGISKQWQKIDVTTMTFPSKFMIDYVRVYQRAGQQNTGCSPKDFPTEDYIKSHIEAYMNYTLPAWPYAKPRNGKYEGSC
jgi:beta-glucanase (GH16 family)